MQRSLTIVLKFEFLFSFICSMKSGEVFTKFSKSLASVASEAVVFFAAIFEWNRLSMINWLILRNMLQKLNKKTCTLLLKFSTLQMAASASRESEIHQLGRLRKI